MTELAMYKDLDLTFQTQRPNEYVLLDNQVARIITLYKGIPRSALVSMDRLSDLLRYRWMSAWFKSRYRDDDGRFYVVASAPRLNGRRTLILMHRYLAATPNGLVTDHINGDGEDNRDENLANVDKRANTLKARLAAHNTSGVRGVSLRRNGRIWGFRCTVAHPPHGRPIYRDFPGTREGFALAQAFALSHYREAHGLDTAFCVIGTADRYGEGGDETDHGKWML
jgi:hypothetical protein